MANDKLGYLNLKNHGDVATIRVLHSSPSTIECEATHWVTLSDGSRRSIKCNGERCVLCGEYDDRTTRAYVHVIDLADMQEKVWVRPMSVIKDLQGVYDYFHSLSNVVITIQRDNSGKYPVQKVINAQPANGQLIGDNLIDKKVAYRSFMTRTNEELFSFVETGVMPEHKKNFVAKEQYVSNGQSFTPYNAQNATKSAGYAQGGTVTPTQYSEASKPQNAVPAAQPTWVYNPTQTVAPTNVAVPPQPTFTPNYVNATQTPAYTASSTDDPFSSPIFRV